MKILDRRQFLHLAAGGAALPPMSRIARAQTYPTHPITMIVPQSPGTAFDTSARIVAERMRGSLKQPIIVENIPGADGNLGTGRAARAGSDGYTIVAGSNSTHVAILLREKRRELHWAKLAAFLAESCLNAVGGLTRGALH